MKNKILSISIIFILLSFIFINNIIFASTTFTFTDRFGVERTVPSFPQDEVLGDKSFYHYAIVKLGNNKNGLYIASGDGYFYNKGTTDLYCSTQCYMASISDGEYVLSDTICKAKERLCSYNEICYFSGGLFDGLDSTTYTLEPMGDFFFHQTPVTEITLAQELEKIQVQEMWKTLMKNVVVSLVVFLVGLVAFLKAWNWLKTQLHKA